MNYEALVNEILARVMAKLQEMENNKSTSSECSAKTCCPDTTQSSVCTQSAPLKEMIITKRVLTESNVADARKQGITKIVVGEKTILTDLAKEYAANNGISIVKN
ncbi:MAG: hypothetical protein RR272_03400 [Synergistaceae bacterium]